MSVDPTPSFDVPSSSSPRPWPYDDDNEDS
jgi:hypothetical protein